MMGVRFSNERYKMLIGKKNHHYDNGRTQQIKQEICMNAKQEYTEKMSYTKFFRPPMVISAALEELTYPFALDKSVSSG